MKLKENKGKRRGGVKGENEVELLEWEEKVRREGMT